MISEKRMYVLVPYNLSDIQKGIQAAHAGMEYVYEKKDNPKVIDWIKNHKTMIILNGGTTGKRGSLQNYIKDLTKLKVNGLAFYEPDINDALTAYAFVLDMKEDIHIVGYLKQMGLA